mgnify:CR=1 FL=1
MKRSVALVVVLVLLPLLSVTLGLQGGTKTNEFEARQAAEISPKVQDLVEKPTVQSSATYDAPTDTWLVLLTETVSGSVVAKITVDDTSGEVTKTKGAPYAVAGDAPRDGVQPPDELGEQVHHTCGPGRESGNHAVDRRVHEQRLALVHSDRLGVVTISSKAVRPSSHTP